MHNICPTCASTNSIRTLSSEPSLGTAVSRELFCEACSSQWFERMPDAAPSKPIVEINAEAISSHAGRPACHRFATKPVVIKAPPPPKRSRNAFYASAFCLSVFLILGIATDKREMLVRHVPQTAILFKSIGLPVNLRGLAFNEVKTRIFDDNGQQVLAVEGTITSLAKSTTQVPQMRVSLRGDDGREIYYWTAQPAQTQLAPGATLLFRTRLASPPPNAHVALVNFANADTAILR